MLKDTENDDFEPSDITDSLGGFALNIIARDSAKLPKVIIKTDSNEGCVDSFTNAKPGMLTLRAPMDASVITPLTTVAIEIASVYLITVERAAELILESIGLAEESIDSDLIFKIDPFQKLVIDGDDSIATVAYASVNVANAISMISSLLYGAGTSSKAEAEAATLLAFAKRIGDTNLVLRKKRRILLKKYTKRLNVSDSSDISRSYLRPYPSFPGRVRMFAWILLRRMLSPKRLHQPRRICSPRIQLQNLTAAKLFQKFARRQSKFCKIQSFWKPSSI